ncbi:MAG: tRNA (adenosine(37)-N6)-threonylcarbamoyltransferase complex dimerization subunit type 1 TsaB, partial [Rickettsiales bacterium]|nr:tRNA (adenosine(37)-N6)-threonylcarbamoyltransferase complex dimerization subunit type 1 TsaB [Rickettsiales bacterium]
DEYLKSLDLEVIHISAESVLKNPADAAKYLENKIQIWLNHPALRAPLHRRGTYFPTSTQSLDLAPSVEKFLSDNNAKFSDLSAIGVVVGPGSFTGIRLGIAYAKGLAMGLSIPLIGVNKFEIYLHSAADSIVALESGRGDFFVSAHNLEPQIMDIETLETRQMDYPRTIGHKPYNLTNALEIVAQKLNAPVAPVIPLYIRDSYVKTNCTNA